MFGFLFPYVPKLNILRRLARLHVAMSKIVVLVSTTSVVTELAIDDAPDATLEKNSQRSPDEEDRIRDLAQWNIHFDRSETARDFYHIQKLRKYLIENV